MKEVIYKKTDQGGLTLRFYTPLWILSGRVALLTRMSDQPSLKKASQPISLLLLIIAFVIDFIAS